MIKYLLFFAAMFFGFIVHSQVQGVWYLTNYSDIDGNGLSVSALDPFITPSIVVDSDNFFTGLAACNSYNGNAVYNPNTLLFTLENFEYGSDICEEPSHTEFENNYFFHFENAIGSELDMYHFWDDDYEYISINFSNGVEYLYREVPPEELGIGEIEKPRLINYINENAIHLNSNNHLLESVSIFEISGKMVDMKTQYLKKINISNLDSGVYILRIVTDEGVFSEKFNIK